MQTAAVQILLGYFCTTRVYVEDVYTIFKKAKGNQLAGGSSLLVKIRLGEGIVWECVGRSQLV